MDASSDTDRSPTRPPRRVPVYVVWSLVGVLVGVIGLAVYFAAEAAGAAADERVLSDGVDRSRLPRGEAVALANLARSRSAAVPHDAGHDHDHDGSMAMASEFTPDLRKTLEAQLALATRAVPRYNTLEEAKAAGYVQASGNNDGAGTHWVKWSLVDRPFDIEKPSMLLFEELERGKSPELIAFSYWVASPDRPEGFAGDTDEWHRHVGMCFENGWLREENIPRDACDGDWVNGLDLWMLHAWVVPGLENQYGQFAVVNPLLCERTCGLEN